MLHLYNIPNTITKILAHSTKSTTKNIPKKRGGVNVQYKYAQKLQRLALKANKQTETIKTKKHISHYCYQRSSMLNLFTLMLVDLITLVIITTGKLVTVTAIAVRPNPQLTALVSKAVQYRCFQ